MRICWDTLEGVYLSKTGSFRKRNHTLVYKEHCKLCGEPYFIRSDTKLGEYCSKSCYRRVHQPFKRPEVRKILSMLAKKRIGEKSNAFKGGLYKYNIPLFDTYAHKISYAEDVRRSFNNSIVLETRCAYCGRWFTPTRDEVLCRYYALEGKYSGENRLYCSDNCKKACPIFGVYKYPKGFKHSSSREVQPELRQLVLKRDNYTCQKCNKSIGDVELHCHHITGVIQNPIESADMDNCITLCVRCHKNVHSKKGCTYHDLQCN